MRKLIVHIPNLYQRFKKETFDQAVRKQRTEMVKVSWFGLGKPRSKFGKWLDKNEITQEELSRESGVNKTTISRICSGDAFYPSMKSAAKIIKALRKKGKDVNLEDFWTM